MRVKIACRDVQKVPRTTEGTLGLCLHDFIFEREIQEEETVRTLKSGIKITEKEHQSKRFKANDQPKPTLMIGTSSQGGPTNNGSGSSKSVQQQKTASISNSGPPKIGTSGKSVEMGVDQNQSKNQDKAKMVVTDQFQQPQEDGELVEKVHIPDNFEESDAESETLSEKLRKIDAYSDMNQGTSKGAEDNDNQSVWHMEVEVNEESLVQIANLKNSANASMTDGLLSEGLFSSQDDKGMAADTLINSQESVITDDGLSKTMEIFQDNGVGCLMEPKKDDQIKMDQPERRRSERLKDIQLTTMEKNEAMAKKKKKKISGR